MIGLIASNGQNAQIALSGKNDQIALKNLTALNVQTASTVATTEIDARKKKTTNAMTGVTKRKKETTIGAIDIAVSERENIQKVKRTIKSIRRMIKHLEVINRRRGM